MGFFKKMKKKLHPKRVFQAVHNPVGAAYGHFTGGGTSSRDLWDPAGLTRGRPQAQPSSYQPRQMQLSPRAQELYDSMRARSAARQQGLAGGATAPPAVAPMMPQGGAPQARLAPPRPPPVAPAGGMDQAGVMPDTMEVPGMANGGKVKAAKSKTGMKTRSKSFKHRPNGKPY